MLYRNSYVRRLIRHYCKTRAALGRSYLCGVPRREMADRSWRWSCTLHITASGSAQWRFLCDLCE